MAFVDRYRLVGLQRNPFSTQAVADASVFLDRGLPEPPPPGSRTLVQVIGDRGYGKSTHLAKWRSTQPGPYHYIPPRPYRARWSSAPSASPGRSTIATQTVYGDEIDRMPIPLRRRWLRDLATAGATVVVGTHEDLGPVAARAGLDVITHELQPLTKAEVRQLLNLRLRSVALDGHAQFEFGRDELETIWRASQGVPRHAEERGHRVLAERVAAL